MLVQLAAPSHLVDPCLLALQPVGLLRTQVAEVARIGGRDAVVALGSSLSRLSFSPALYLLEGADDTEALALRWRALEFAWGVEHLTAFSRESPRSVRLASLPFDGRRPSGPQRWMICGAVLGLLRAQGYRDVSMDLDDGESIRISWSHGPTRTSPRLRLSEATEGAVAQVVASLEAAPEADWTPRLLATATHQSLRTLNRRFQSRGETIGVMQRRLRIRSATLAIAQTQRSFTEVAHETGFSDAAHLSRSFRAASGMTPSEYRRVARRR
ncbi:AraC family transcriptional regulator [Hyalangium versicolor]|uniref:AraC family transcriptional regulator n=1 Tax=Hyalangium versicolor TaxID=2861190 RepID=UPI001CCC0C9D|nr:helix-turn-helix transcriptional regulator [Hyalangium versicolor]